MTSLLRRVLSWIGAPFRWLFSPVRRLSAWLNQEPEETPTAEVFSRTFDQPSLLVDHLEDLRRHLLRALLFLILTTAISVTFSQQILGWLTAPIGGIQELRAIEVTEAIGAFMRISLLSGVVLGLPYILLELFLFLNPALKPPERKLVLVLLPIGTLLFVAGMAFAYYVMLPAALPFLLNFLGIPAELRPASYIQFVTGVMFWLGVAFEFPLVVYILALLGVVNAGLLWRGWRIAIVAIAVLAAMITPTIDPVNMALVMAPMTVLYFMGIGMAALARRGETA